MWLAFPYRCVKTNRAALSYNRVVDDVPERSSAPAPLWEGFLANSVRPLSAEERLFFLGKRVLITGGGGFLGSALARTLFQLPVSRIVVLDIAEYGLYQLEQDLQVTQNSPALIPVVGSVREEALLRELFAEHRPEIVFHAAALKHVPLMESNALAAAETNILGTHALVEEATRSKVQSFVLLSTDKAVEPISIMGATKRIAEQIVLCARGQGNVINAVRLPNVLGSTGSVAPLFARQIAGGGPVTVTHPEVTRYFISQIDAVRHLLRSAWSRTPTGLIVPLVGPARRVEDLAEYMIQKATNEPRTVRIVHTGLRTADKLHEQLVSPFETAEGWAGDPATLAIFGSFDPLHLKEALAGIRQAVDVRDRVLLLQSFQRAVPDFICQQGISRKKVGGGA